MCLVLSGLMLLNVVASLYLPGVIILSLGQRDPIVELHWAEMLLTAV